jgi:pimeloyl-ACP methyl ester carboxylesterase
MYGKGEKKMKNLLRTTIVFIIINIVIYQFAFTKAYKVSWIVLGILAAIFALTISILVITGVLNIFTLLISKNVVGVKVVSKTLGWTLLTTLLIVAQTLISEKYTYIPETSPVAYEQEVEINGTTQYITIRGNNIDNPIILFLAGGPGGSQVQATRMKLKPLEDEFTIITWEQPGSGKSYNARDISTLTKEDYLKDGHALTTYIQEHYLKEKIYLMGESWGSYLAIKLATAHPEDYHAIVNTGQMVDFAETEVYCYDKAYEIALERNDEQQLKALNNLGEVPITEGNISIESGTYLLYLHQYMNSKGEVNHTDYDTFDSLFSPEYSVMDSVNFMRALLNTFSQVYKQLYEEDLRETNTTLEVPIYILHGVHDVNAPTYLVEDYYEQIEAPDKALIWFEHSGHSVWITENELFAETVKDLLLK